MSTIARNLALDMRRLKSFELRSKTEGLDSIVYSGKSVSETGSSDSIDVSRLLGGMDEKYRLILEMMYLQGYSQSDISEKLDIPLGTVKTRAKKAIDILRETLEGEKKLFTDHSGMLLFLMANSELLEIFRQ